MGTGEGADAAAQGMTLAASASTEAASASAAYASAVQDAVHATRSFVEALGEAARRLRSGESVHLDVQVQGSAAALVEAVRVVVGDELDRRQIA